MTREEILEVLEQELATAREKSAQASTDFYATLNDIPSGLPHPDGTQRIRNASIRCAQSRTKLVAAMTRLNNYIIHGTVPGDLQA
ncbi:MAG: hypothetical protein ABJF23_17815 [Bryobacteraceae bacterium]